MKKIAAALAVAAIAASATVAFAGSAAKGGINGSLHDINAAPGSYQHDSLERTCVFCHTPHNAVGNTSGFEAPLWNHGNRAASSTVIPYAWAAPANLSIPIAVTDPLIGPSRLCMACHDGVTAVDSHGSAGSMNGGHAMTSQLGADINGNVEYRYWSDLSNTHPIGFSYDDAFAARGAAELRPKGNGFIAESVDTRGDWNTHSGYDAAAKTSKKIQDTLYGGGIMTCASCHDVHNTLNAAPKGTNSYNYFLYAQEEGSAICLSCHVK